jgi:hypothetical protein
VKQAIYTLLATASRCSSETSVDFQRTTRCYIPEARTLSRVNLSAYYKRHELYNAVAYFLAMIMKFSGL